MMRCRDNTQIQAKLRELCSLPSALIGVGMLHSLSLSYLLWGFQLGFDASDPTVTASAFTKYEALASAYAYVFGLLSLMLLGKIVRPGLAAHVLNLLLLVASLAVYRSIFLEKADLIGNGDGFTSLMLKTTQADYFGLILILVLLLMELVMGVKTVVRPRERVTSASEIAPE